MLENPIDINKIFEEGYFSTCFDKPISSLYLKRVKQIIDKNVSKSSLEELYLKPPIINITNALEDELRDVLKLFSNNQDKIKKRIEFIEVEPKSSKKLHNFQNLQPAVAVALLPPGNKTNIFSISKITYDENGLVEKKDRIESIENEEKKLRIVCFNASSLSYEWVIENQDINTSNINLILFEEVICV